MVETFILSSLAAKAACAAATKAAVAKGLAAPACSTVAPMAKATLVKWTIASISAPFVLVGLIGAANAIDNSKKR